MADLMIFGCTGYTGRLAAEYAKSRGLNLVLAGRTESKVRAQATAHDVPYRVFDLSNSDTIVENLKDVRILLNCSGPFKYTAEPFIKACIRSGTHYLDVAVELDSYRLADELDQDARDANVLLMPGCGGSVVMLGCLAAHALDELPTPTSIDIALRVAGPMSRGSAVTAAGSLMTACLERVDGRLIQQDVGNTCGFDFDNDEGTVTCFPVTLPDLITLWKSTNVPTIRTFVHVAGDNAFPSGDVTEMPDGPTPQQREAHPYHAAVIVTSEDGSRRQAVLHTVNGYTFTAQASIEAAVRILGAEMTGTGFRTPAGLFGKEFVHSVTGSVME